jgi:cytochrome P450
MAKLPRPPGPQGRFLIGISPLATRDQLTSLSDWAHEYGDLYHCRFLIYHVYFANRPEYIEQLLVTQNRKFIKGRALQANRELFGNGLLTSEGELWQRQRKLIQPAFHRARIQGYARTMVECTNRMLETFAPGQERDIHQDMMTVTLDIAARTLFSVEIGDRGRRIERCLNVLMHVIATPQRIMKPLRILYWNVERKYHAAVRELEEIVYAIVHERREAQKRGEPEAHDLLAMLLAVRDEDGRGMDDRQIRDEVLTLLLAGHETTALALSWTWYLLAQNPEVERKLHEEFDRVLAGRAPGVEDLPRLTYTEKVIKESLRLYPPAYAILRLAIEDAEIGGFKIPKGSSVGVSPWVTHRDPRFFPEPERFRPERWTEEFQQKLPRFAYFPFGGGPRICVGAQFALMEAPLILATIAQHYSLRLVPGHRVDVFPSITLRPKHGIRVTLEKRVAAEPELIRSEAR